MMKKVSFGTYTDAVLADKAAAFRLPTDTLMAVYRRGAATFAAEHRDGMSRDEWAMARVDAFTRLYSAGRPANSAYISDNDLLPTSHPRSSAKTEALVASAVDNELTVSAREVNIYDQPEDAILALTEYMGLGYSTEPAVRASWLRAVRNGEDPYKRARLLAEYVYDSLDSDLLPIRKGK